MSALADRRWALTSGTSGLVALASYLVLVVFSTPPWASALLTAGFTCGFALLSIALHLGITTAVAPRLGLLAAVANTVAAGELTAMLLVQVAVKAAVARPDPAFTAIWLGLDVAWDLFGGVGTVLFGWALWHHSRFRPLVAASGILVGLVLLILNIGTFPTPPAAAGLFDAGPLVGLWYIVLSVSVLIVALGEPRTAGKQH